MSDELSNQKTDFNKEFLEKLIGKEIQRIEQKIDSNRELIELSVGKLEQKVDHNKQQVDETARHKADEDKIHFEKVNGEYGRIDKIVNLNVSQDKFEGYKESNNERLAKLEQVQNTKEGSSKLSNALWAMAGAVFVTVIGAIILYYLLKQ